MAGIAGIVFCVLSIAGQLLIRSAIPPYGQGSASEVVEHSQTIAFSLNLVPFAGIAFLWFVAVLRDHLGEFEDRFFATIFFGSGLGGTKITIITLIYDNYIYRIVEDMRNMLKPALRSLIMGPNHLHMKRVTVLLAFLVVFFHAVSAAAFTVSLVTDDAPGRATKHDAGPTRCKSCPS